MKLSDQEQVVLKAIQTVGRSGLASIASVIKAVGYPKATTKKVLINLSNKGAVSLYRHDYPQSLKPEQRKLMVRIGRDYFNAVSMRKKNPSKQSKGKSALKKTGRALKGFAKGALSAGSEILGAGAMALNPKKRKRNRDYPYWNVYHVDTKKSPPYDKTFLGSSSFGMDKKEAIEKFRQSHYPGRLRAGTKIIAEKGVVSMNPTRRIKVRNKYIDLVIKGQAKKTPDGWKVGKKTFAQGRGTVNVSSGYYLDRHTGIVYAKRERNPKGWLELVEKFGPGQRTLKRSKSVETLRKERAKLPEERQQKTWIEDFQGNVVEGYRGASGWRPNPTRKRNAEKKDSDHPIEVVKHYRAGPPGYLTPWQRAHHAGQSQLFETGIKPAKKRNPRKKTKGKKNASRAITASRKKKTVGTRTVSKARNRAVRRSVAKTRKTATRANPTRKGMRKGYREAKRISKITKGRYFSSELGQRKAARHEKRQARKSKLNPSAESIRKEFAGSVSGSRDLFFPQGTPSGKLAKLGKLVLIQTEQGTIKPVNGTAWLCADSKERLHIGSTSNTPLFDGPARSLGKVTKVEYESSKPHLGYRGPIIWFHHMGERGGTKPTLHADGKGGLKFKGGNYKLTTRGIEH